MSSHSSFVRALLAGFAIVGGGPVARGQDLLWQASGSFGFGTSIALAGDLDGDGVRDVLVGQPDPWGFGNPGHVFGLNGRTGAQLFDVVDSAETFGENVASLGDDFDGDGVEDFLADSASGVNPLVLFSGADQHVLKTYPGIGVISTCRDLDGDQVRDLVCDGGQPGPVNVRSTKSGALLFQFWGDGAGAFAVLDDVDLDGVEDLAVGRWNGSPGAVDVYSLKSGRSLGSINGHAGGRAFGRAIRRLGDLDGDGATDFVVSSSPLSFPAPKSYLSLVSGRTLAEIGHVDESRFAGPLGLGAAAGDVDGDGAEDFCVGYSNPDDHRIGQPLFVHSGRTLEPIVNLQSQDALVSVGGWLATARADDLDGDGAVDFLVTSYGSSVGVLRGGKRWLSAWHVLVDSGMWSDRSRQAGSPTPPSPSPGLPPNLSNGYVASGFAPGSLVTLLLVSDRGARVGKSVAVGVADAAGVWQVADPFLAYGVHDYLLQAIGVDAAGRVVATPLEEVEYR